MRMAHRTRTLVPMRRNSQAATSTDSSRAASGTTCHRKPRRLLPKPSSKPMAIEWRMAAERLARLADEGREPGGGRTSPRGEVWTASFIDMEQRPMRRRHFLAPGLLAGVGAAGGLPATPGSVLSATGKAPGFDGIDGWLNTEAAVGPAALRGRVTLVNFWTYSCIYVLRTLPDRKSVV